jgi:hypothetical protein
MTEMNVFTIVDDDQDIVIKDPNGDIIALVEFKSIDDVTINVAKHVDIKGNISAEGH